MSPGAELNSAEQTCVLQQLMCERVLAALRDVGSPTATEVRHPTLTLMYLFFFRGSSRNTAAAAYAKFSSLSGPKAVLPASHQFAKTVSPAGQRNPFYRFADESPAIWIFWGRGPVRCLEGLEESHDDKLGHGDLAILGSGTSTIYAYILIHIDRFFCVPVFVSMYLVCVCACARVRV